MEIVATHSRGYLDTQQRFLSTKRYYKSRQNRGSKCTYLEIYEI